eukprot:10656-Heterococcus_DN1.PRE.2
MQCQWCKNAKMLTSGHVALPQAIYYHNRMVHNLAHNVDARRIHAHSGSVQYTQPMKQLIATN